MGRPCLRAPRSRGRRGRRGLPRNGGYGLMAMDCVLFDLDDTLYDQVRPFELGYREAFGDRFDALAAGGPAGAGAAGGPPDVVTLFNASRRHSDEAFEAATRGEISMEEMYVWRLQRTFADFGVDVTADECLRMQSAYAAAQRDAICVSPRMAEVLDWCAARRPLGGGQLPGSGRLPGPGRLPGARHPMGIITNGPAAHQME